MDSAPLSQFLSSTSFLISSHLISFLFSFVLPNFAGQPETRQNNLVFPIIAVFGRCQAGNYPLRIRQVDMLLLRRARGRMPSLAPTEPMTKTAAINSGRIDKSVLELK